MDITPHVNLLRSLRGDRVDYKLLIGEAIDNAFDAGATSVSVIISQDEISFQDNGCGITKDRIASMFSLGDHGSMTTTSLGRFGIGLKSQAVNAGDHLNIFSRSKDGQVNVAVNWRKVLQSGTWLISDPVWTPNYGTSETGTTITISGLRKAPTIGLDKILDDLSYRFFPAINEGKSIFVNDIPVSLAAEPPMTDIIDVKFGLSGGRNATLRAGILANPSKTNRVHVSYKHRVIMPQSSVGCDGYGGLNKMFARLQIGGPWHLGKFKTDLTDEDERDELEEAVGEALQPILMKCNSSSISARIEEIASLANDMVPLEMRPARPRKTKTTPPTPSLNKRHKEFGIVDPKKSDPGGPAKVKVSSANKLLITFDGVSEEDGVGAFRPGRVHRVDLSRDHPYIAELLEHRDTNLVKMSMFVLAIALYEQGLRDYHPQLDIFGSFGVRIARTLSMQYAEEVLMS